MTSRSEIAARLAAATPGPWFEYSEPEVGYMPTVHCPNNDKHGGHHPVWDDPANLSLIARTPEYLAFLLREIAELEAKVAGLERALEFYADPDTYVAIGFFPDPPSGEFMDDFEEVEPDNFKPGKRARAALTGTSDTGEVESGWVIEGAWSPTSAPEYWCGSSRWSSDHRRALRFARQQDACQASNMMLDGILVRVSEHEWVRENACAHQWEIVHAVDICKLCGMGRT